MKVLVVSQYFWPENFRVNNVVDELLHRGHDVTVLTGLPNYPSGYLFKEYRNTPSAFLNYHGVDVVRVPLLPRGKGAIRLVLNYISFFLLASTIGLWKLRKRKFDVVFVFGPSPVTVGIPAVIYKKISRTPVVFWVLDLWPETLSAVGVIKSPLLLKIVGLLVSYIYNRCDLILGQSKGFLENIAKYCKNREKIYYFPNWAENIFKTKLSKDDLAQEISFRSDMFSVVFAGNIGEAQDFSTILDAAEQLKDDSSIRWLIVGDGRMSGWLAKEVQRRGLEHCFFLLGRFPLERMPSFYGHADALLVSLKADPVFSLTIPGKLQSYLMAGIPIIGLLDGEGAAVIREAKAGIACASGDAKALALAICQIAALSKEDRQKMGTNGQFYAETEFGREILMSRLDDWMTTLSQAKK